MTKQTKTSKNSEAKTNINMLSAALKRIHDKREEWQGNAYKRSNEELYAILQDCHDLLTQLRGEIKLRKKLNDAIQAAGFTLRSNTSLELKVVRAVFGVENNRIHVYTRVLQIAKHDLPSGWTIPEWIEEHGGIEEVRRKPKSGMTAADRAKQYRELAEEQLPNIKAIGKRFNPTADLQPSDSGDYAYAVALVRVDADGKASLVFGTNKNAIVKAVVTLAGKTLAERKAESEPQSKHAQKRKARDAVLDSFEQEIAA